MIENLLVGAEATICGITMPRFVIEVEKCGSIGIVTGVVGFTSSTSHVDLAIAERLLSSLVDGSIDFGSLTLHSGGRIIPLEFINATKLKSAHP